MPDLGLSELRAAFKTDLAACWQFAHALHPADKPYAFVLYGVESFALFTPHLLTEESLTEVSKRYLEKGRYETLDECRKALRYSVADSPRFAELENKLVSVNRLTQPHKEFFQDETAGYKLLATAAIDAFKELDKEGLFGTGKQREQLLLLIITEDTKENLTKPSAKELNPPSVFERFEADTKIEGTFASCTSLALSPDGKSLYFTGGAKDKAGDSLSQIVACDIEGLRLKRRWAFSFPKRGDSGRTIAVARDNQTILALRSKNEDEDWMAWLMRFGRDKEKVLETAKLPGQPATMAVSHDESRIAVGMFSSSGSADNPFAGYPLQIVDKNFSVLKILELPGKPHGLMFLRNGDLLAATEGGIFRVDKNYQLTETGFKLDCRTISVDAAENWLVTSPFNMPKPFGANTAQAPQVGYHLLQLPSLASAGEFKLDGANVERAAISPDGRWIACDAKKFGAFRKFVAVCERETGREIARYKAGLTNDIRFLNDSRAVVIGYSGNTTNEPITFWPVPGI